MSSRNLKIGLAVSLALKVFLIGAGASAAYLAHHVAEERAAALRSSTSLFEAARGLAPADQQRLRVVIKDAAKDAWTDFKVARERRAEAAELGKAASFDPAAVRARLDAARQAETRGRLKLESAVIGFMQTLSPADRAKLAPALKGRRLTGSRHHGPERGRPPREGMPPPRP